MYAKIIRGSAAVACVLFAAQAGAQGTGLTFSVGADYTSGKYGTSDKEEWWTLPFIARYDTGPLSLKVTAPWVRRSGLGRPEIGTSAARTTTSGLGDIVAGATYTLYDNRSSGIALDLTGKIKFGTADEAKLLGTGENDYSLQGDIYKSYNQFGSFATLGWKKMGDTPTTNFRNPWYASFGGSYRFSSSTSGVLAYDYRRRVLNSGSYVSELTASISHKFGQGLKLQGYIVTGFADASPDWGAGAIFSVGF